MSLCMTCSIKEHRRSYEIEILRNALRSPQLFEVAFSQIGHRCVILTDTRVGPLYGEPMAQWLRSSSREAFLVTIPAGEQSKTRAVKEQIEDQLFRQGCGRDTALLVLGGGMVTDMGGFVAATYCRGIPLFLVPTTLLGMVDAAIGGKNGVDVPWGKNLIGTIYQPTKVVLDPSVLSTLPDVEFRNGIAEMIKHGAVADEKYFDFLAANVGRMRDEEILERAIAESCRIKMAIVEDDERERDKRHLLNFGHTIGHAVEFLSNYRLSHGEAIAIGMVGEGYMSNQLQRLSTKDLGRLFDLLRAYGLPFSLPEKLIPEKVIEAMIHDKKTVSQRPRFVLLSRIGDGELQEVDESLIRKTIEWINDVVCRHSGADH